MRRAARKIGAITIPTERHPAMRDTAIIEAISTIIGKIRIEADVAIFGKDISLTVRNIHANAVAAGGRCPGGDIADGILLTARIKVTLTSHRLASDGHR